MSGVLPKATVNVDELMASVSGQAEELAQARLRQEAAEAELKRATQEMAAQGKAHHETRERLETDCEELAAESDQLAAECQELEAEVAREREARAAAEAELGQVQHWAALLQHQLRIARSQLERTEAAAEERRWWTRLVS